MSDSADQLRTSDGGYRGLDYSKFPKTEDEWIAALCRKDDRSWACVPEFMLPYAKYGNYFDRFGRPHDPDLVTQTPFELARFFFSGDFSAPGPPWRGTGMLPQQFRLFREQEREAENALRRKVSAAREMERAAGPYVYFIGGDTGAIKIGFSKSPKERLTGLQIGSPIPLRILAFEPGDMKLEESYHARFAERRLHGEWFDRCPEILAEIERLSA